MSEDAAAALRDQWLAEAEDLQARKTVKIGGRMVDKSTNMPTWEQGDNRYHINTRSGDTNHVTKENHPKTQYFFEADTGRITGTMPKRKERGRTIKVDGEKVQTKKISTTFRRT